MSAPDFPDDGVVWLRWEPGVEADLDTGLEIERLHFASLFATEDQRTGMRSFIENGPGQATFAGR